jgi:Protein of unknown function (DUF4435)
MSNHVPSQSIRNDLTYEDKYVELLLDISNPKSKDKIFIFVEGETDIKLFSKFFNDNCNIESIPGGNTKVEECTNSISEKYSLVFGIRDSDFLQLGANTYPKKNVFLTDFHDLEMTLIAMDEVFSAVAAQYTDIARKKHNDLRSNIIKTISDVSYIKWLNAKEELEIKFKKSSKRFHFNDLMSFTDWSIKIEEYFNRLLSIKDQTAKIKDFSEITTKIEALKLTSPHPFHLCNGHDFIEVFRQFLDDADITGKTLSSAFNIACTHEFWKKTSLYKNTQQWAVENNCAIY